MDFLELLGHSDNSRVVLVTSNSSSDHSPFLTILLTSWLRTTKVEDKSITVSCLYHSPDYYTTCLRHQRLLNNSSLELVDCQKHWIDNSSDSLPDLMELLCPSKCSSIYLLDDISVLLSIGYSMDVIGHYIATLLSTTSCRIVIGCHVGIDDDSATHLCNHLRIRSQLCVDIRPLQTGYSRTLDGELSISRPESNCVWTSHINHFLLQSRTILCFPPGTSKMVA